MTTPIDDAVAALTEISESYESVNINHVEFRVRAKYLADTFLERLRAQPGKMRAGEITRNHAYAIAKRLCDAFNVQPSLQLEEFIREEMNALAAAQPEPRPLRELIAEGYEWFTLIFEGTPILVWRESDWDGCPRMGFKDSRSTGEVAFSVFADCPAIPIPKPTVTPK